jgi:hypothetical protein
LPKLHSTLRQLLLLFYFACESPVGGCCTVAGAAAGCICIWCTCGCPSASSAWSAGACCSKASVCLPQHVSLHPPMVWDDPTCAAAAPHGALLHAQAGLQWCKNVTVMPIWSTCSAAFNEHQQHRSGSQVDYCPRSVSVTAIVHTFAWIITLYSAQGELSCAASPSAGAVIPGTRLIIDHVTRTTGRD